MKRITIAFAISALTLCAQNFQPPSWGARVEPPVVAQFGPVIGRPLSGSEFRGSVQTIGDATERTDIVRKDVSHFYRDGSGRTREESKVRVEIFDPVSHYEYDLNPSKKTYIKVPLSENSTFSVAVFGSTSVTSSWSGNPQPVAKASFATVTEDLGQQIVNGLYAKGSRVTETVPAGAFGNSRDIKIVNERWYSDDLQILVKSSNKDPRFGENTYDLTDISRSAPDPSLFLPPSDYTETDRNHR